MKHTRKELVWGILLFIIWLVIVILPEWLLLIAAIALIIIGVLPSKLHEKVKNTTDSIVGKINKKTE